MSPWRLVLLILVCFNAGLLAQGYGNWRNVVGLVCCAASFVGLTVMDYTRRKRS